MEVFQGKGEVLGKNPVFAPQTQNLALLAVLSQALAAAMADSAGNIDFPHHPLFHQGGLRRSDDFPYEFVAGNPPEIVVAFQDFQVGAADSRQPKTHQGLPRSRLRQG